MTERVTWRDWRDISILLLLYAALWVVGVRELPEEDEESRE